MAIGVFGPEVAIDRVELEDGMRLTRKFIAALVIGVAFVALIQGYFDVRRERDVFDLQMHAEATALGRALGRGVEEVWIRDGEAAAREFLYEASDKNNSELPRVRWFWLDATVGDAPKAPRDVLAPLSQGQPVIYPDENRNQLLTYVPVNVPEPRQGGIEIVQPFNTFDKFTSDSLRSEVLASIAEVVLAAMLALLLGVVFIGRPISRLAAKARRVGTGDLTGPLQLRQRDELGELANEINLMCDRLAEERSARESATEQLRHADRLTTVGKLASGIAHELGTPLNVVSGRARLIMRGEVEGKEALDSAKIVADQADRMTALIRQLLDFARPRVLQKVTVNVTALAARVAELVQTIARKTDVSIDVPPPDDALHVEADEGALHQMMINLVVNAIHAMPDGGTISIHTRFVDQTPPPYVEGDVTHWLAIEVKDTGTGMDDATKKRIFEPFFTTKPVGDGTGLGLSVTWGIVREHRGWIDVQSSPGKGSTFTVYLPGGAA